jgi:hypothetical protein
VRYANGADLRDLHRRGSGLTFRRLWVLVRTLPADGWLWSAHRLADEKAKIPTVDQIRARAEHYRSRGN